MPEVISGMQDGKKWISGVIPMKHNVFLEVDTRSGNGVPQILGYLRDFISYQASRIFLPAHSTEDIVQELNALAIAAIPEYDASKCANMLTFLQNHIRNRTINIYKFATEQRRTAVHGNFRFCKAKCPSCKQYTVFDEVTEEVHKCVNCGNQKTLGERWRKYPVPIAMVSANESFSLPDGSQTTIQEHCSYEDVGILVSGYPGDERAVISRVTIASALQRYDGMTSSIASLLMAGYNVSEIARKLEITNAKVRSRMRKLSKNRELVQLFADYAESRVIAHE